MNRRGQKEVFEVFAIVKSKTVERLREVSAGRNGKEEDR